jgi:hypothetical protein
MMVFYPTRYADDFIILVSAPPGPCQLERAQAAALAEKAALATVLKERLRLELSETKTLVTPVTERLRFLGHHVFVRSHPTHGRLISTTVIPKDRSQRLREHIKGLFGRKTIRSSLGDRLQLLNPLLRGWSNFYRHAWGAKRVFNSLDNYVWWTIFRWLRKKHGRVSKTRLCEKYGRRQPGMRSLHWEDGGMSPFPMRRVRVRRFMGNQLNPPCFAVTSMESPVHSERCTPGSEGGARKPTTAR